MSKIIEQFIDQAFNFLKTALNENDFEAVKFLFEHTKGIFNGNNLENAIIEYAWGYRINMQYLYYMLSQLEKISPEVLLAIISRSDIDVSDLKVIIEDENYKINLNAPYSNKNFSDQDDILSDLIEYYLIYPSWRMDNLKNKIKYLIYQGLNTQNINYKKILDMMNDNYSIERDIQEVKEFIEKTAQEYEAYQKEISEKVSQFVITDTADLVSKYM